MSNKNKLNVLAVDIGASGQRAVVGSYDGSSLTVHDMGRLDNVPCFLGFASYWDFPAMFNNITGFIGRAQKEYGIKSYGLDSFGGCTAFIDKDGRLLENPAYPRNPNGRKEFEMAREILPVERLSEAAGYDMRTEYRQLAKLKFLTAFRPDFARTVDKILFLPSVFNYYLTGKAYCEFSNAVCQMWSYYDRPEWNMDVLSLTGVTREMFPDIVKAGTRIGPVRDIIRSSYGLKETEAIAVAEHDTSSAMSLLESESEDCIFLAQGTKSVLSCPVKEAVLTKSAAMSHFGNEGGYSRLRLTCNIDGLWFVQQCRAAWAAEGMDTSYAYLEDEAGKVPGKYLFNMDDPELRLPGNMPEKISRICGAALTQGETIRAIYDSLSVVYKEIIDGLARETGVKYKKIRALGGGCASEVLCQCVADTTCLEVVAGPTEATALGNIAIQLMALGEVSSFDEANELIQDGESYNTYTPRW